MYLQRNDPMDEFPDVTPVTVRNAALLLREACKGEASAVEKLNELNAALKEAKGLVENAMYLRKAAEHRLKISALQPNGGEQ